MKKAFSLVEVAIAITLLGVMAGISFSYINISTLSKQDTKTQLQSHFNIITAIILQCKELSNAMPMQTDDSLSDNTLLNSLKCDTSPSYSIHGEKGAFIPEPLNGFTAYTAKENGSVFYFSTSTTLNSSNDEVLQELQNNYSSNQFEFTSNATTRYLNFYLSR